jgi:hypothetical protein
MKVAKNTARKIELRSYFTEFKKAFQQGIDGIVHASEIYVRALDVDPRNADKFKEHFADYIPASAWQGFEAVGRKWMHPRLLLGGVADRRKNAAIKKLSYAAQERVFRHELFPVVVDNRVEDVDLLNAPAEVVEQVCDHSGIRSVEEQNAYLKGLSVVRPLPKKLPYIITNGKIYFSQSALMTKEELQAIIAEM